MEDLIAKDEKAVARWKFTGRHTGEFLGIKPTNLSVQFIGIDIYRMEDGLITEHWHELDMVRLLGQVKS